MPEARQVDRHQFLYHLDPTLGLPPLPQRLPSHQWPRQHEPEGEQVRTDHTFSLCTHRLHPDSHTVSLPGRRHHGVPSLHDFHPAFGQPHLLLPIRALSSETHEGRLRQSEAIGIGIGTACPRCLLVTLLAR